MSSNISVSVIIPVYNAQRYLRQMLDSVISQSLKEIEIICVDDGSTDSSASILEEYKEKDARITVLHQQNQYAGVARNLGMDYASGEYLVFWDSDDFFEPDALAKMHEQICQTDADVCVCGAERYYEEKDVGIPYRPYLNLSKVENKTLFSPQEAGEKLLQFTCVAVWNKMFRKSFIMNEKLRFQALRNSNDVFFGICALCTARSITVVNKHLVHYRRFSSQSLTSTSEKAPDAILYAWSTTHEHLKKSNKLPERSFANKALESIIFMLHMIQTHDIFVDTVRMLQEGGLEQVGIIESPFSGYYYSKRNSDWQDKMRRMTAENFYAYFARSTYVYMAEENMMLKNDKRLLKKDIRLQLKAKEKEYAALMNEYSSLKDELDRLKKSKLYRFGRMIQKPFWFCRNQISRWFHRHERV